MVHLANKSYREELCYVPSNGGISPQFCHKSFPPKLTKNSRLPGKMQFNQSLTHNLILIDHLPIGIGAVNPHFNYCQTSVYFRHFHGDT